MINIKLSGLMYNKRIIKEMYTIKEHSPKRVSLYGIQIKSAMNGKIKPAVTLSRGLLRNI